MHVALLQLEDERRVPVAGRVDETLAGSRHYQEPASAPGGTTNINSHRLFGDVWASSGPASLIYLC